jgi:hypothetical protein
MLRPTLRMKVRHRPRPVFFHECFYNKILSGILYWHMEAFRVNCARFEPGRSMEPHATLLLSDDTDTTVATIGPLE